jgi:hypothetical protein
MIRYYCDICKKAYQEQFGLPKSLLIARIYQKAQKKGGKGYGFHICKECLSKRLPEIKQ